MSSGLWDYRDSVWEYRESTWTLDGDLVGYEVVATDGRLGTVVRASSSSAAVYLVVDVVVDAARAGAGLRLVPAGAVASMDHEGRTVRIDPHRGRGDGRPALRARARRRAARRARRLLRRPGPAQTYSRSSSKWTVTA
ncbi:MAG TPA: hypothetical protein VLA70_09780 [Nocardioides sp.]|nr:hypothetical protein [Nocardioides sp.]